MAARTAKQKAALKKAQAVSARKRKGKGRGSKVKRHLRKYGAAYAGAIVAGSMAGAAQYYGGKLDRQIKKDYAKMAADEKRMKHNMGVVQRNLAAVEANHNRVARTLNAVTSRRNLRSLAGHRSRRGKAGSN